MKTTTGRLISACTHKKPCSLPRRSARKCATSRLLIWNCSSFQAVSSPTSGLHRSCYAGALSCYTVCLCLKKLVNQRHQGDYCQLHSMGALRMLRDLCVVCRSAHLQQPQGPRSQPELPPLYCSGRSAPELDEADAHAQPLCGPAGLGSPAEPEVALGQRKQVPQQQPADAEGQLFGILRCNGQESSSQICFYGGKSAPAPVSSLHLTLLLAQACQKATCAGWQASATSLRAQCCSTPG